MTNVDADSLDDQSVAVIGMAGRFPGARDLDEFWSIILEGRDAISRASRGLEHDGEGGAPNDSVDDSFVRARGVLDNIDEFDARFFDFTPAEAAELDPQHRIWLEIAYEALESAGYAHQGHSEIVSVFAGALPSTYLYNNLLPDRAAVEEFVRLRRPRSLALLVQNDSAYLPTRTAYKLGLRGPAINVQTACSTSLVAVCMAMQSLMSHESDISIAGGVCVTVPQQAGYFYQEGAILSRDGVCRPYDAEACGTVFGNGAGAVVLRRLADARRDGDRVLAVILGAAINNDGRAKVSYFAPSVQGQAEVIVSALALAGVSPETIGYVEGHGTATPMGDPIEVEALTQAFRRHTSGRQFCRLGSVKGNVGHLDSAAGVAGLIRTILALQHRQLPGTAHFRSPNPELRLEETPFCVSSSTTPWPEGPHPRRAAVSSFGIGGTNAHVVLEEEGSEAPRGCSPDFTEDTWLLLSAKTPAALDASTARLARWIGGYVRSAQAPCVLGDVAHALRFRRELYNERRAVRVHSWCDAAAALDDQGRWSTATAVRGHPKLFFAFPGQGSLRAGALGRLLRESPELASHMEPLARTASRWLGLDLYAWLCDDLADSAVIEGDNAAAQLASFCVSVALTRWLESRGLRADGLLGHSLGEWVAAHIAGVLDTEDAISAVYHRGRLMQETGAGAALIVHLSPPELEPYLGCGVTLACVNASRLCLVSGRPEDISACEQRLRSEGITCGFTSIHVAVHSPLMDPVVAPFAEILASLHWNSPERPLLSAVSGAWMPKETAASAEHWSRQLRERVQFELAARTLSEQPCGVVLEVGMGTTLTSLLAEAMPDASRHRVVPLLGQVRPNEQGYAADRLSRSLGELWACGVNLDLVSATPPTSPMPDLPTYPFQRERFWVEAPEPLADSGDVRVPARTSLGHRGPTRGAAVSASTSALRQPSALVSHDISADAPRDDLELRICNIWQSVLGLRGFGIRSSFFDLGGNSLLAVRMLAEIRDAFGVSVSLGAAFQNDSVEGIANLVRASSGTARAAIVPLNDGEGSGMLLYCVLGIHLYWEISRRLADTARACGVFLPLEQAIFDRHPGDPDPTWDVEELAAAYLEQIRSDAPDRPFCLLGASFGGVVAYEIARKLEREGHEVPLLIMVDSVLPSALHRAPAKWMRVQLGRLRSGGVGELVRRGRSKLQKRQATNSGQAALFRIREGVYLRAVRRFDSQPTRYGGRTLLIKARDQDVPSGWDVADDYAWTKRLEGRFESVVVPGSHIDVLAQPYVDETARVIKATLRDVKS